MSSESMLEKLDRYYQSQGISALGFNCKHREACSALCAPGQMISMPASYVGPGYEGGKLPRLLFLSSDTNSAAWVKDKPLLTTLQSIRDTHLTDLLKNSKPVSHWYQTILLAKAILAPFYKERFDKDMFMNDSVEYVAHARSARCKDNSIKHGKEGNPLMYENCREFVKGEVVALQPDIIITQGGRARDALKDAFPVKDHGVMLGNPCNKAYFEIIETSENHNAIKIVAWHPCAHWRGNEKQLFTEWAAKSVQEFILPPQR